MGLEIINTVRNAVAANEPLRQSDVLALAATCEQLWHQIRTQGQPKTGEHRASYMRHYMRRYREKKRLQAAAVAQAQAAKGTDEVH